MMVLVVLVLLVVKLVAVGILVLVLMLLLLLLVLLMVVRQIIVRLHLALYRGHVQVIQHELVDVLVGQTWVVGFHDECRLKKNKTVENREKKLRIFDNCRWF